MKTNICTQTDYIVNLWMLKWNKQYPAIVSRVFILFKEYENRITTERSLFPKQCILRFSEKKKSGRLFKVIMKKLQ